MDPCLLQNVLNVVDSEVNTDQPLDRSDLRRRVYLGPPSVHLHVLAFELSRSLLEY
jgi:hypothetical protein